MSAKPGERRLHAALVAALAALVTALGPGVASAYTFVDKDIADFPSSASTWTVEPGVVLRRPVTLSMNFDGPGLPASLAATPAEAATVAAGALTVNAGLVTRSASPAGRRRSSSARRSARMIGSTSASETT